METIKGYKGFNHNLTCSPNGTPFQYEIGKEYEQKGDIKACRTGFHFCEEPLAVLGHYSPADDNGKLNRFCEVEGKGQIDKDGDKVACSQIKIGAEINFLGLAKAQIEYVKSHCDKTKGQNRRKDKSIANAEKNSSVASNSGDSSVASNSGDRSVASNSGDRSVASNSGYWSVASNSGYRSVASNSGYRSVASNSGYRSVASNSGDSSVASNSGYWSVASNSGDWSVASNSGDSSVASNSGDWSVASNSGYWSVASNSGGSGISVAWGFESQAKGGIGSYLVLSEWNYIDYKYVLANAIMVKVDGIEIKADTLYRLRNGVVEEVL